MTREEQIRKAAYSDKNNLHAQPHPVPGVAEMVNEYFALCFKEGAEWADSHPHWIPVEEELPEERKVVWVRKHFNKEVLGEFDIYDSAAFCNGEFQCDNSCTITHWMEIVPPRKEE